MFGFQAGYNNLVSSNSYFGHNAGTLSTTGGSNSFLGFRAGFNNISGSQNTFIGSNADGNSSGNIDNATAIGANAKVTQSNNLILWYWNQSSKCWN
jgi:hypothetical protein